MKDWFYFILKNDSPINLATEEITSYNIEEISLLEDLEKNKLTLCGKGDKNLFPTIWQHIEKVLAINSDINWEDQWKLFCPYFNGTICKVPLSDFCKNSTEELLLNPGPGFGDLSHETTLLMLKLIGTLPKEKTFIDLGCGSGILGCAAIKLGATKVYCLDIDQEALAHTVDTAYLNELQPKIFIGKALPLILSPLPEILLLNMTFFEQKKAIESLPLDQLPNLTWITSGILKEQEKEYLAFTRTLNLVLKSTFSKGKWKAFIFTQEKTT